MKTIRKSIAWVAIAALAFAIGHWSSRRLGPLSSPGGIHPGRVVPSIPIESAALRQLIENHEEHSDTPPPAVPNPPPRAVGENAHESSAHELERAGAWSKLPRSDRDLGKLFALAPLAVTGAGLVRHTRLNVSDCLVPDHDMRVLDELIERHVTKIREAEQCRSAEISNTMQILHDAGQLTRLDLESLPPPQRQHVLDEARQRLAMLSARGRVQSEEDAVLHVLQRRARELFPDARSFRHTADAVYYATLDQLPTLDRHVDYGHFLRSDFFHQVVAWFTQAGLTNIDFLQPDVQTFERLLTIR